MKQPTSSVEVAQQVAELLGPLAADLTTLSITGKQAHWHIRGVNFLPLHEFLDTIVDHARAGADLAAERAVMLGAPVDGRVETLAQSVEAPTFPEGFVSSEQTIKVMLGHLDSVINRARHAVEELGEIDDGSQDVAIEILRSLEMDRWFLASHQG